jgi:enediyne biosynthesis protein E4
MRLWSAGFQPALWAAGILPAFVLILFFGCRSGDSSPSKGYFTDITEKSGLNFVHDAAVDGSYFYPEIMSAGGGFLDYDNDGDLDIYLVNGQRHGSNQEVPLKNRLYRQERSGDFADVTDEAFGSATTGYGMGIAVGDMENDGDVDLYVTNAGPDQLFQNNGNGTFSDITKKAGINNPGWGSSATFLDFDRDGFLDLYVVNYVVYDPAVTCTDKVGRRDYCGPQGFRGEPDQLYRNNGNGTFTDVSLKSEIGKTVWKGLGVVSADFNNDLYPDIYVANDGEPANLWINQKDGTFKDLGMILGSAVNALGQPEAGMGVAAGDADGDGDLDLFKTHLRNETNTFYRHMGEIGFQDDTAVSNLGAPSLPYTGFGTGFFDYDQDGDLDLAVVNGRVTRGPLLVQRKSPGYWDDYAEPNFLFENEGTGHYRNVSDLGGKFTSDIENSRGLALGDIDNDGDIDLLVTNGGGPARLFRNDVSSKGHWIIVRVRAWNRDATGAIVSIQESGKRNKRMIQPGYSYLSSNDPRAHFGLGNTTSVDEITVIWPDGKTEIFPRVKADQIITVEKGKGKSG